MHLRIQLVLATLAFSTVAFSQIINAGVPDAFQVRYASNLNIGDSVVNLTDTGASELTDPSACTICVNVYTFDPAEELISCCTCSLTPNGLVSFSVLNSPTGNSLTPAIPISVVIKLVGTNATSAPSDATSVTEAALAPGLLAWGTTIHALPTAPVSYGVTETAFSICDLSAAELAHLTSFCGFIQANGSGFGICPGLRPWRARRN
jgi:hypothetical protein